jgi:hypothetical protein
MAVSADAGTTGGITAAAPARRDPLAPEALDNSLPGLPRCCFIVIAARRHTWKRHRSAVRHGDRRAGGDGVLHVLVRAAAGALVV